jgi:endoglucanase
MSFKQSLIVFCLFPLINGFSQNFVSVNGRNIVTANNKPLLLRGVNLGFWLEPEGYPFGFTSKLAPRDFFDAIANFIGPDDARKFWVAFQDNYIIEQDIQYIKKLGFNSVRVPFDYRLFANENFLGSNHPRGFELIDKLMGWCRKEKIYVILDMHCAPGGQGGWNTDDGYTWPWLFEDNGEPSRQQTIDIWVDIAKHYANDTSVIGYDLLGEPITQYCDSARLNKRLEPFYKRLTTEIRKVDSNHIFFLAGAYWNRNFDVFSKPFDSKLVYTTHLYSRTEPYCSVDYFVNFSKKHNVPIWIGEFGERTTGFIDSLRTDFEKEQVGWCLWPYKKMNNNHGIVQIIKPEGYDTIISKYVNHEYHKWENKVISRPNNEESARILWRFIENCKFRNCKPSDYYYKALQLNLEKQ